MNCPKCGNVVAERRNRCEICGKDLTIYKCTYRRSNAYYNRGLEKAKVRDLSGAVIMLKKSLEMNKRNTNARNLLGLVFFEMGETVAALSEWVISKHFQAADNDADFYINKVQENPTKLDAMNQAIKKYNIALESAKQNSDDLAIIQLKKVVNLNPRFIRALQLLALIYMKNNEFERARRCLLRAARIDLTNTTTLRYQSELDQLVNGTQEAKTPYWSDGDSKEEELAPIKGIKPISSYKEDKPNVWLFVNLILGVIIGIAVVFVLIVPTVKQNIRQEYVQNERDFNSELSAMTAKLTSAENQVELLNQKLTEKQAEIDNMTVPEYDKEMYDNLLIALYKYDQYQSSNALTNEATIEVASLLAQVDTDRMEKEEAVKLCELVRAEVYPLAADITYNQGKDAFDKGDYENSAALLSQSYQYNPDYDSTLYNLAKAYQKLEQFDLAREYYEKLKTDFPNSSLIKYVNQRLSEMEGR